MLEFLCGAQGSGKTEEIYKRAKADAKTGRSVFILVPDQYSMFAEQELIETMGLSAQNKIQVLTFSRLSNMVFSKLGPLRNKHIDKAGKYLMACRAMQVSEDQLCFFRRNVGQSGFADLIVSLISEFKRYGITPDILTETANKTDDTTLKMKLLDFAVIQRNFDRLVSEQYFNAEDNLTIAAPKICKCDFLQGTVYVNFFKSFTPTEYFVLGEIMKKADLCVALCCDTLSDKSVLFSSQVHTYATLCKLAKDLGIETKSPVFLTDEKRFLNNHELKHIKDNFFSYKTPTLCGIPSAVHIYTPDNRYLEVTECAQLLKRLCRTKGYSLNDFLILTGSMSEYELIIPAVFDEFGLNYFLDQKTKLTESPLMRMIISVLEILAYGFSYQRVMTILRSGFWNISKTDADIFENYILAADITHKDWNNLGDWSYNPQSFVFDMEQINSVKLQVTSPLIELLKSFSGRKTVPEICQTLCAWFNKLNLHERVSQKIEEYTNSDRPQLAEQLQNVWNSFVSVLNQISNCMPDTFSTFTEFYQLFTSACGELTVGSIPSTQDKVIISEVERFRSVGTKVVIVLGVCDSAFPKSHTGEGLISDAERNKLRGSGITLAPDAYHKQKEEQFLVYSALTTASEQLYLFAPASNRDGKSLGQSSVIKRIKALFPDICVEKSLSEFDSIEGQEHTFSELTARLFEVNWDIEQLKPLWKKVYEFFCQNPKYAKRLDDFSDMNNRKGIPPRLSKATAEKLYGKPLILSVSKLEKYNSCAFAFFMRYGLFAEERLLGGLKSKDTGSILHSILCDYFKANKDADYNKISKNECRDEIAKLVDSFAENNQNSLFSTSNYYAYMMLRLKSIATATAWKLVNFYRQSKFRPSGFEISFGRHGTLPAYQIPSEYGDAYLEGFIDKLDTAEIDGKTYFSITDYKSSEKQIDPEMVDAGITIQPLIYSNAVSQSDDTVPAAMLYMQMNDPILTCETEPDDFEWESKMSAGIKIHGIFLDEPNVIEALDKNSDSKTSVHYINCDKKSRLSQELMSQKLNSAKDCASKTADKILGGEINAEPPKLSGFNPCAYCPYISVCKEE